jgi:DNA-binding LacI/PurR family transcriptional regulator
MATIYDIAKLCNLSPTTVSKALSGASDVSVNTRNRVRQVASQLDYIPDGQARGLSQNRTWTICVLCQDGSEMGLRHYLFAGIIESFKSVVERHGYDIVFISNQVGKMGLSYYGHCRYRKADGVLIVNTNYSSKEAIELIESDIPKIAVDYSDALIGCVMTDCDKSMSLLYNHLYDLGHRNIVYMHGEDKYVTNARINSLRKAMALKGETLNPEALIQSQYYSLQGGYQSMQEVLVRSSRPTAVIASDDYSAIGAIKAVRDAGLSVPGDISIVGFDGIEITQLFTPRLTTIRQDTTGMGVKAAESLIKQILGIDKNRRPENIILEPQLLIGTSCRNINEERSE